MTHFVLNKRNISVQSTSPTTSQKEKEVVIIDERQYHLSKSKNKFILVGLCSVYRYEPCIKLMGSKNVVNIFKENHWEDLVQ